MGLLTALQSATPEKVRQNCSPPSARLRGSRTKKIILAGTHEQHVFAKMRGSLQMSRVGGLSYTHVHGGGLFVRGRVMDQQHLYNGSGDKSDRCQSALKAGSTSDSCFQRATSLLLYC